METIRDILACASTSGFQADFADILVQRNERVNVTEATGHVGDGSREPVWA